MKNTKELRWGVVGGLLSFPFGLVAAGWMVKQEFWVSLMGTEWAVFKSIVGVAMMIGFAVGIFFCGIVHPDIVNKSQNKEGESDF